MLLALDTSTRAGSVAVLKDRAISAHVPLDPNVKHGTSLATAVASLALDLTQIEVFAVTIGPGSFTGLRIALAFVKGLAMVVPRPVLALSTLEVLAAGVPAEDGALLLPVLDARRGEAYAALFTRSQGALVAEPGLREGVYPLGTVRTQLESVQAGRQVIAAGDGTVLDWGEAPPWKVADPTHSSPDARVLARLASERWSRGERGRDASDLEPVYLMTAPGE